MRKMKKYKKYIITLGAVLLLACGMGGYYIYDYYHPEINIHIMEFGKGEDYKIETPSVVIASRTEKSAPSVELDLLNFWIQYDHFNEYIFDTYKAADIKLDIEVKKNQTILKYYGTVTTSDGETIDYNNEIACDFVLDATITK